MSTRGKGYSTEVHEVFGRWLSRTQEPDSGSLVVEDARGSLYCWLYNRIEVRRATGARKWREQPAYDTPVSPFKYRKYAFGAREVIGKVVNHPGHWWRCSGGPGGVVRICWDGENLLIKNLNVDITIKGHHLLKQASWTYLGGALRRAQVVLGKVFSLRFEYAGSGEKKINAKDVIC